MGLRSRASSAILVTIPWATTTLLKERGQIKTSGKRTYTPSTEQIAYVSFIPIEEEKCVTRQTMVCMRNTQEPKRRSSDTSFSSIYSLNCNEALLIY